MPVRLHAIFRHQLYIISLPQTHHPLRSYWWRHVYTGCLLCSRENKCTNTLNTCAKRIYWLNERKKKAFRKPILLHIIYLRGKQFVQGFDLCGVKSKCSWRTSYTLGSFHGTSWQMHSQTTPSDGWKSLSETLGTGHWSVFISHNLCSQKRLLIITLWRPMLTDDMRG